MDVLFDGLVPVHYGFVNLVADEVDADRIGQERAGQANGLCGAQVPGQLHLVTGLHTGEVPFRVVRQGSEIAAYWHGVARG